MWPVEVIAAIRHSGIMPLAKVCCATGGTYILVPSTSHVVDDSIHIDSAEIDMKDHYRHLALKIVTTSITHTTKDTRILICNSLICERKAYFIIIDLQIIKRTAGTTLVEILKGLPNCVSK